MRIFLINIFFVFSFCAFGQVDRIKCPTFKSIYFKQGNSLIDSVNYSRLDSIGQFIQSDTNLVLQFQLYQLGFSSDSLKSKLTWSRVKNVENYLKNKFKINIDDTYLTDINSGGPVERFTKEEIENKDKMGFVIKNCP